MDGAHDAPALSALTGFWVGPDVVVRGAVDGLHAVKRSDGSDAWDLPTPQGGNICGMSAGVDAESGIGIVVSQGTQRGGADCSAISGVDVRSGKVLWTTPVSSYSDDPSAGAENYGVASGMAIIDSDRTGVETAVVALDLRTGTKKWTYASDCEHRPAVFAVGGARVVVGEECKGTSAARVLDAATGAPVPDATPNPAGLSLSGPGNPRVLSAEPLVIVGDASNSLFATLVTNGPSRAQVTVGKDVVCAGGRQAACWSAGGA
ncbi:MAG: PQQ-binding-like beta-propeller repeat protein, partial [Catenulispora sp.]